MEIRSRFSLVAAALLALALAACSDNSSSPGGGTADTTPPAVAAVTPVDAYHLDVTFNEQVSATSAQDESHYVITPVVIAQAAASRTQGGGLSVTDATLKSDKKTVSLTTNGSMSGFDFNLVVTGVSDTHGNDITEGVSKPFTGSDTPDSTPPQILEKSPAANATHVALTTTVTIKFSEPLNVTTFNSGVSWNSGAGPVDFTISHDGTLYTLTPSSALGYNQLQTIALTGVQDPHGNTLTDTEWSFTTTNVTDHTPPTLVSTSPNNLAANVDVNANLSLTFSEAIDTTLSQVQLTPDVGDGVATWSNGGKTVTFNPAAPLLADQQYTLTIYPLGVTDLAGNGIEGLHTVVFTTGAYLAAGSIAGTITGDAGSAAADPTGATVFAADGSPFNGSFNILASTKVAAANTYSTLYLPDGFYYLVSILDTSGNGNFDPGEGDAIGAYGVNFVTSDFHPDSVVVAGGAHVTGINWTMLDPSAINGTVTYSGGVQGDYNVLVGLFSVIGFDPNTATPVAGTDAFGINHEWSFNTLDQPIPDGNYYVGAFLDVNGNQDYDPATEPAGLYGGLSTPTAIHITNGNDMKGIVIPMLDPAPTMIGTAAQLAWPAAQHNATFQRLCAAIRQSQLQASR